MHVRRVAVLCAHAAGVGWAVETRCMGVGTNYRAAVLARGGGKDEDFEAVAREKRTDS